MIVAVGTDLVDLDRIEGAISRHGDRFLARILTPAERAECARRSPSAASVAARFAAKEAVMKCLGTGRAEAVSWRDIEVETAASGQPRVHLSGAAAARASRLGIRGIHVSLSHTAAQALAMAVAED